MKKTILVVALAAILVFAFASTALAKNAIVQRAGATSTVAPQGTYSNWSLDAAAPDWALGSVAGNAGSSSPHGNYTTSTIKCAVCHAVHAASPAGDTLLKMKASDSCYFCHVSTDSGIPGKVVYGGSTVIAANGGAGQDAHTTGTNCGTCHASVHGANAIKDVAALRGLLLKATDGARVLNPAANAATIDAGSGVTGSTGFLPATYNTGTEATNPGIRYSAIGLFCQGCHAGSYQNVSVDGNKPVAGALNSGAYATTQKTGHRVLAMASADWNAAGTLSSSAKRTGQVAFAPADSCVSCHDAPNGLDGSTGFPHFTPGSTRFLDVAGFAGDAKVRSGVSRSADPNVTTSTATTPLATGETQGEFSLRDGVCLKCHRGNGGASGVSVDF